MNYQHSGGRMSGSPHDDSTDRFAGETIPALNEDNVKQLRRLMHDLSSVFTGILVTGGLLNLALTESKQKRYSASICEEAERGAGVLRQARSLLTAPSERMANDKDPAEL